ncbi:hypothetical protein A0U89_07090 [Kozakia baliensis]|uniref:HTH cro/C1-type domain-containing protein n=2 Tax=Kozakia baliensis TaxID=153496 RepID=A0A1D8UTG6_9PROT|nr:hypothetical protein A0U89_07090 [Kozakia baliensis]
MTPTAFAREIGVSHATVSRWLDNKTHPSPPAIRAVFQFTNGEVTASDLLNEGVVRGEAA